MYKYLIRYATNKTLFPNAQARTFLRKQIKAEFYKPAKDAQTQALQIQRAVHVLSAMAN